MCRGKSDDDGCGWEEKERKTETEVDGQCKCELEGEGVVSRTDPKMKAAGHEYHLHIEVGKHEWKKKTHKKTKT